MLMPCFRADLPFYEVKSFHCIYHLCLNHLRLYRQLLRLARRGADPFNFSFVDYYKVCSYIRDKCFCCE